MFRLHVRAAVAFTIAVCAAMAFTDILGSAATVTAVPGLAPQFSRWPVPLYTSHVENTLTWAPVSYEIDTNDSVDSVLGWYQAKLKGRTTLVNWQRTGIRQLQVDGGNYVINLTKRAAGAGINVIKN